MQFDNRENQKSRFPQKRDPDIYFHLPGKYNCFGIRDLYLALFVNVKPYADSTMIVFPQGHSERKGKGILSFLLPNEILQYIENRTITSDYKEFIVNVHKSNKIAKLMQELFFSENEEYSKKKFAELFRQHFIVLLKDAVFSPYLKDELESIARVIIPKSISEASYNEFTALIEGGHKSISIAIANIFASAMLGLFSMKYHVTSSAANKRGIQDVKTYLLNKLGMEYIWTPLLVTTSYEELSVIQQSYDYGEVLLSYKNGLSWLKKYEDKAPNKEIAVAYKLIGLSLYGLATQEEKEYKGKEEESIRYLKKAISTGEADSYIYWFMYEYYKDKSFDEAKEYIKTAFAQNYAKAVIEIAFSFLYDDIIIDGIAEESLLKKINVIINNEINHNTIEVGKCLYLRGRFSKMHGNELEAQKDFEDAARKGNERAKQELILKERNTEKLSFPSFTNHPKDKCCFANTLTGNNLSVLSTFPSNEWALYSYENSSFNGIQRVQSIDEFLKLQHFGEFEFCRPKTVFLFMSENEEKNLNDSLSLLDKLFNIVLRIPDKQKWNIIDNTYIYVSAKYETASMLIDANISDMGSDIYFKIHIADENRDTVHKLICDAPLFLPALNRSKKEEFTKLILLGSSEMNYCFIKECIACAYLGDIHPISITLLGEEADKLENKLHQECPGIFSETGISCIRPEFIKCNIRETDFPKYIYSNSRINSSTHNVTRNNNPVNDIVEALKYGNYFIVDYADDLENIKFAMDLRTWLLRSRGTFDRAPIIAVKCSNEQNSYLISHLPLSGQMAGDSYYNKYDLLPFGISTQTYNYSNLIDNPVLTNIALQIHKYYYLDNDLDKNDESKLKDALKKCNRSAENDFYSYSYNADSSISTAIGLCYRFFAAGCTLNNKEEYLKAGALTNPKLLKDFEEKKNSKIEERLAKLEQSRWNSFMLVRGWLPADVNLVKAYEEQSSGSAHKHTLAKLHPFIKEWDDLDDPELRQLLGVLKSKAHYDKNPQVTTRKSIADTIRFFKTKTKEDDKIH